MECFKRYPFYIAGFYVYRDLKYTEDDRTPSWYAGYYGLSKDFDAVGRTKDNDICTVGQQDNCQPIEKTFYLQYQWFPFYVASLALLFYLPHFLFRFINTDIISLRAAIKSLDVNVECLVKNFFNYQINPPSRMYMRIFGNIIVKICYIIVNVVAFTWTDHLLYGEFKNFGTAWLRWNSKIHQTAFDYTKSRKLVKPGEILLPTFGICEVFEIRRDATTTREDHHRFVCEISQNILYQYVLLVLWFLFIIGMTLGILGLVLKIIDHMITATCFFAMGDQARRVYRVLNLRECEYVEFVRRNNLPVYGELIRKLKEVTLSRHPTAHIPGESSPSSPTGDERVCGERTSTYEDIREITHTFMDGIL